MNTWTQNDIFAILLLTKKYFFALLKMKFLDRYRGITNHRIFLTAPRIIFEGVAPHRTNHPTLHQVIWSFYVVYMRLCK